MKPAGNLRRPGVLRRHGRPRLQEIFPALLAMVRRGALDVPDHRRRARKAVGRRTACARTRQHRAQRKMGS